MKKVIYSLLAAVALFSCDQQDDTPVATTANVSFVVNGSGLGAGRVSGLTPEKVVVSVEDKDGKVIIDNKVFNLSSNANGFSTDILLLKTGEYRVTKYIVVSGNSAAYATPRSGAQKATLIDKPLPFEFTVVAEQENSVAPRIVGISSQDNPQHFGYNDFGYEIPGGGEPEDNWYNVRVKLEMIVGEIYYPNLDAIVRVMGFDEDGDIKWGQTYIYTGPESNDVGVKDGFHHYTIEVEKWGKTLAQTYTSASLKEVRVKEGQVPVTQVFQTEVEPKKIATATTSMTRDVNGAKILMPVSRVNYEYKLDGRVSAIDYATWSETTQTFVNKSESLFTYEGTQLKKIANYDIKTDELQSEDFYTYDANGDVIHVQHKESGITTEVDIEHLHDDRLVKVKYRLSNGTSFEYEFQNQYGSLKEDKTTRGGQLCSTVYYSSDKSINPMKHLGYIDYLMRNYSISNRLTESANYIGCSFPSMIAERYSYVYNDFGYPVRATTHFKGTETVSEVAYTYFQD